MSGMKLRSEKNWDGDEVRDAEAGAVNVTTTDPFIPSRKWSKR